MENYIKAYCEARNIMFGDIKDYYNNNDGDQPNLLMCLPKYTVIEVDIMPIVETVLQDENLSKILISLNHNLCVWRLA